MTTFVDTNVLAYAFDRSDPDKQAVASARLEGLWLDRSGVLSTQILQEFYAVATHHLKLAMKPADARRVVQLYAEWPVVVIEPSLILTASRMQERHRLSFWDALVLEAARLAGAEELLTEDLQHGRVIDGIRIENPFITNAAT